MRKFDYSIYFNQAIQAIRNVRSPRADRADNDELQWSKVIKQDLFDFGLRDVLPLYTVVNEARRISVSCLCATIMTLAKEFYGKTVELINEELCKRGEPCFTIIDRESKELFIFKQIEECNFWKSEEEPDEISTFMNDNGIISCKYIYLMYDFAYLQVIGHNDDKTDMGRGTNIYSIMDFISFYFGNEEKERFEVAIREYIQKVNGIIGYIHVKSLTPNTLINFKRVTENYILKYKYEKIAKRKINNRFVIHSEDYPELRKQFIDEGTYLALVGYSDFAESIVTAEWLYNSMKKAEAVDLTIVGMGYFKAIEQLLFELIKLHKNNPNLDENDFTIGAIATYYKINSKTLFREELHPYTKSFIKEAVFEYKDLRNGYFHKHNIHDWEKIDKIREATFELAFLALGSHRISQKEKDSLKLLDKSYVDDFYKLCEYMNYHAGNFFLIEGASGEQICEALNDQYQVFENSSYIRYSGIYVRDIESGQELVIRKGYVPRKIVLIKMIPYGKREVKLKLVKVKTIYENGKYVGSSIVEEESLYY